MQTQHEEREEAKIFIASATHKCITQRKAKNFMLQN
jgi:hypothetical protein